MLPYVYRVTKYDPADRNDQGHYVGTQDTLSDHGPVEAAYLAAMAAFAADTTVAHLTIREPGLAGLVTFGMEAPIEGHGLIGLFPPDLVGYHDGAQVTLAVGLELLRAMLRDSGPWCRLEAKERFFVHVGWDQYMYIGSVEPCEQAVAHTHAIGLFAERLDASPYDPSFDEPAERRPADEAFWTEVIDLVAQHGTMLLEEGYLANVSRWHRLHTTNISAIRAGLAPRARLLVWPDLSTDVAAVLRSLPHDEPIKLVWENQHGYITSTFADDEFYPQLRAQLTAMRAAMALPIFEDERHPLLTALLPDHDGVLRARWAP
ncbi:hypothetical protein [Amycolatopsis taiwanensis]|uniref:hypothetical protein n=1 Tax=Amycolatopsis taiwanensis TaxID=342230 RepID=UPI0004883B07|nr:hypothetical protein [Amycolatopsis taiwanensis]